MKAALALVVVVLATPTWAQTGRPFTLEDLDDIAEYLNRSHYRLPDGR